MVGIGFAFTENILYLAAAYIGTTARARAASRSSASRFLVRCVSSPFAHPLFTTFTGIGVGIAVTQPLERGAGPRAAARLRLRGRPPTPLWNASTLLAGGAGFFGVYLLVMVPVFVSLVGAGGVGAHP